MSEEKMERWRYPRFFTENISDTSAVLNAEDSRHVAQVLRMRPGDIAVICDGKGTDYLGELESAAGDCVFNIIESSPNEAEPAVRLRLFQAMPKGDKMDFIVQKAVECGACEIIPFISKQCGRGVIPRVGDTVQFADIPGMRAQDGTGILFYECAEIPLREAVPEFTRNIDIVIGSEGGFEPAEAERLVAAGFSCASLGKRILRCETAPIAAISVLMNMTGNM